MTRRVLLVSQTYPPDPAAVGQLVADLAEGMCRDGESVTVVTSRRGYDDPTQVFEAYERLRGVDVYRVSSPGVGKASLGTRIREAVEFTLRAWLFIRRQAAFDVVVYTTSPPIAPLLGLLIGRRATRAVFWVMDVNPDQAIAVGAVSATAMSARILAWINRRALSRVDAIVALDHFMLERLRTKGRIRGETAVIPPWSLVDGAQLMLEATAEPPDGSAEVFTVMYSGNMTFVHPLDTIVEAARRLGDRRDVRFEFIGGGNAKASLLARAPANVSFRSYGTRESLLAQLAAGDLHVVTMGDRMVGIVHPSKIYGAIAAGRPVLYVGPPEGPIEEIVVRYGIGWSVRHGDVDGALRAIAEAIDMSTTARASLREKILAVHRNVFAPEKLRRAVADVCASANVNVRR